MTMFYSLFEKIADPIGMLGVFLTLLAYLLISTDRVTSDNLTYAWLNIIGALLLLLSLLVHWNLPSVIIEIAWISISLIGLYRGMVNRRRVSTSS